MKISIEIASLSKYTKENAFEGIKKLAESAKKMANMYESI